MSVTSHRDQVIRFCPLCGTSLRPKAGFCHMCGQPLHALKKGDQIGNYVIERLLGAGGIGAVYLSHHRLLKLWVALKIHDYFPENEHIGRAFLRSSNYLSQLEHPNIVHLYDYGFQGGKAYQVIEYVNGPTFAQIRPHPQTKSWIDRCIEYFAQMLDALHYSHTSQYIDVNGVLKQGIIHGDIKPHNIFLDHNTDMIKISDFMIPDVQAFLGVEDPDFQDLESDTRPFGTPEYMAPEQKKGQISPQTDIFSLGVTMYQLVTGYSPNSTTRVAMLRNALPPHYENSYVPVWLSDLITRALQKDPTWRFQTIAEMIRIFQNNRFQENTHVLPIINSIPSTNGQPVIGQFNNIVASLNTTSQMDLVEILKLLKETIMVSMQITPYKKKELVEIINQIGEEATKIIPNTTLLRIISEGLLGTLGTIQDASLPNIAEISASILDKLPKEQEHINKVIRILFLAANPKGTPALRLDEEIRGIDLALRQADFGDRFDIKQHWAVRVTDLQGYLLRHKPDIVHFSGHGSLSSQIILEDNNGTSFPVPPQALSQVFSALKDNIRCVILNACF